MNKKIEQPSTEKGPYMDYIPSNLYGKFSVGRLNIFDPLFGATIAIGYFLYMIGKVENVLNNEETAILNLVMLNRKNRFYLGTNPPFVVVLFSFLLNYFETIQLKYSILIMASLSLLLIYMILRRNNVSVMLSIISVSAICCLPHFRTQSIHLSIDVIYWLSFLGTLYFWRLYKLQRGPKLLNLAHIGMFLGVSMSTKALGFVTWIWIICCSLYDTWNTLNDISVSMFLILKKVTLKFVFIVIVPLQIFLLINYHQITNFKIDSPEYSRYVSPYFQSYLRNGTLQTSEDHYLHFGDTITLRHTASLGGYLTSYNISSDGSNENSDNQNLVTLSPNEESEWTHWIIENAVPDSPIKTVRKFDDIMLRHKITGKLLRASDSSPPVSEQEYDKMVCTTGDINYKGNRDEKWTLETVEYSSSQFSSQDMFNITSDEARLFNQGRQCTLLGHDIRLPEWGFHDQEVLCLDSAMNNLAQFKIKIIESESYRIVNIPISSYNKFRLIFEWLTRQYRYFYSIENFDSWRTVNLDTKIQIEMWPFNSQQDDILVNNIWILSFVGVLLFSLFLAFHILIWNPWKKQPAKRKIISLDNLLLQDIGFECSLGWFLHFYVYMRSPSRDRMSIINYFPSYILGFIVFIQISNTLNKKFPWTRMIIPLYVAILYKLVN